MSRKPRVGLALGSGAARGWAHIGIIRALERLGVKPDLVAGCSIGSFVGAAYAAGELDKLESWVRGFSRLQVVSLLDPALSGGLFRGEKVFGIAANHLGDPVIESLPLPFACVATELDTGREIWLKEGPLRQCVRASCGMPGILTPTLVEDRWLVDGAVVNPVPISLARAMGAEVVIAVNLNADMHQPWTDEPDEPVTGNRFSQWLNRGDGHNTPGMWSVMTGSINIMQERITRARMAGDPPEIQLCPRLGSFSIMDFHRASDAINEGEACVERNMEQLKDELSRLGLI
ncbi:patatin-like phospholipase RssA [Aeromonas salmonicida]|uniref:patatin-like phospholipase RssA n=1 Tax=Aeromonas salmonicida TaxID=645 RepID=UPI00145AF60A|nr:patatin-like phospholipase RssA [Aeromonas salmonicida]